MAETALTIRKGELTKTSLSLPKNLSEGEWLEIGEQLGKVDGALMWWIGDWLVWKYPARVAHKVYEKVSEQTALAIKTLQAASVVSRSVKSTIRMVDLSWNYHQIVAPLPEEEQTELLAWCLTAFPGRKATVRELMAEKIRRRIMPKTIKGWDRGPVVCGDALELMEQFEDESIDMIFMDPPYDRDSLHFYWETAAVAGRILKPYGNLITYTPNYGLNEVIPKMGDYLTYWWTICLRHSGHSARQEGKGVIVDWKPLTWFVKKGRLPDKEFIADMIDSEAPAKELHIWQQSSIEAEYCIKHLTRKGDIVLDPFAGSGTSLAAAKLLDRVPMGIEIDPNTVRVANKRLADVG